MNDFDLQDYEPVPYEVYTFLDDKLRALLSGEILYIKELDIREGRDMLVKLDYDESANNNLIQMSYDVYSSDLDPRYWITYDMGFNELALLPAIRFEEWINDIKPKFLPRDTVHYISRDGQEDYAFVKEIYVHKEDKTKFIYLLSRDLGLYSEDELR